MAILFPPGGPPLSHCSKKPRSSGPYRPASRSAGSPSIHRWPAPPPPTEEERIEGGSTRKMRVAFWPRNSTYETGPPSENTRHLTDFHGTLELARNFGLERQEIAAVYAGELTIEQAR
jgi:hypothetical protein